MHQIRPKPALCHDVQHISDPQRTQVSARHSLPFFLIHPISRRSWSRVGPPGVRDEDPRCGELQVELFDESTVGGRKFMLFRATTTRYLY